MMKKTSAHIYIFIHMYVIRNQSISLVLRQLWLEVMRRKQLW